MSTQAIGVTQTSVAPGELAAAARVRELQQLIEKARGVATGASQSSTVATVTGEGAPTAFAAALRAAGASTGVSPMAQGSGATEGAGSSSAYDSMIEQAALRNGLEPALLHGLIQQESGFNPDAQSSAGAMGLTQLMPATASSLGVTDPLDPEQSIEGGARYLSRLMGEFAGNTSEALAAYNAGPAAVSRYGGVPPYGETESYVSKVLGYAESYRLEHAATASGVSA
jgi:soluble lytic murein transglycosylase-like protein